MIRKAAKVLARRVPAIDALITQRDGLLREVAGLREQLQSTHEQLTSTHDQLQSTREQLTSTHDQLQSTRAQLTSTHDRLQSAREQIRRPSENSHASGVNLEIAPKSQGPVIIKVARGQRYWLISPDAFEVFAFRTGDILTVEPQEAAARFPITWGDVNVKIETGRSIRVPSRYELFDYKGFQIPAHLISLTGAGPDTFELIGKRHIECYDRFCGIRPDMTLLEIGCGIGRDALQLIDFLNREKGRYIGTDVTRDSILWCQDNITAKFPNFEFHHFDAENELYNPHGHKTSMDFAIPAETGTVDRIFLASVFTHLFEAEVLHYMREFARVLKPDGQVYATFFLRTPEALEAAKTLGTTQWRATFEHELSDGVFGNDPTYPRGAVAFTDSAIRRLVDAAGLRLVRPYLKGSWSGLHDNPDDGQDVAILARA